MMFNKLSYFKIVIALSVLFATDVTGQVIDCYGIKIGYTSAWQNAFIDDEQLTGFDKKNSLNVGLFSEFYKGPWYIFRADMNYSQKGMNVEIPLTNMENPEGTGEYLRGTLRLNYLSLSVLPNIYREFHLVRVYIFAGPRVDIELSSSIDASGPEPVRTIYSVGMNGQLDEYSSFQLGLTTGAGIKIFKLLPFTAGLEFRYNPDLSWVYSTRHYFILNNSIDILITVEL